MACARAENNDSANGKLGESASIMVPTAQAPSQPGLQDDSDGSGYFSFSKMSSLLEDPAVRLLVEQISNDPVFSSMTKQLQGSVHHKSDKESFCQLDKDEYFDAMKVIMQNPQFVSMAEKLGNALIQNPDISKALQTGETLSCKEQHETNLVNVHDDQTLKSILKEIEAGGPSTVGKYWNDPVVLSKLGRAMGVGATGVFPHESSDEIAAAVEEAEHEDESSIHYYASFGKFEDLRDALRDGVDKDEKDCEGRTALHFACGYGELKCVEELLTVGASLDAPDENNNTSLHYAASYGQCACVELLLKKGASITARNLDGKTPLEVAKSNNQDEAAHLLEQAALP